MAVGNQVVDIGIDPLDERRRRRRAWLRIGIPIGSLVLMVAGILAIAVYTEHANRRDALALSDDLLATLQSKIQLAVSAYLAPAARAAHIGRDIGGDGPIADRLPLVEKLAATLLREIPQIANVSFGDEDGNYVLVRRGTADGLDTKIIANAPGARRVTWIHRNAAGEETGRQDDPSDDYDPRTRPWYKGALTTDDLFWTGVYVFFTDKKPGLTASVRYHDADGRTHVVGVDITLEELSHFLASLQIGRSGRAVIMDGSGRLIAAPTGLNKMVVDSGGTPTTASVDALGDSALTHAYDRYRIEGPGSRVVEVDGRRYISAVTPLSAAGRDWSIMMVVPEDDFIGFVASNNRHALAMSLVIVVIAALLAALLVRQGLRGDRAARLLLDRQDAISRQSRAFATLAAKASLFDPAGSEPPRVLTETLADIAGARRASIWRVAGGGRILRCEDSFERDTGGHVDGLELHRDELPQFFAYVLGGEEIEVADAATDKRTAELHRVLMDRLGTRVLLAVPVRRDERVVGSLWLEDAVETAGGRDFLRAVANMVALRMAEGGIGAATAARAQVAAIAGPAVAPVGGRHSFTAELVRRNIDPAVIGAEIFPDVAVMVMHLTDPVAMAVCAASGARPLSDRIACELQEVAAAHNITYLKIVGQEVIGAAGIDSANGAAAPNIADAAVAVRDRCLALFEDSDHPFEFRIGIDYGSAIGTTVGTNPQVFNLWGEVVRTANAMAASAPAGAVQATEAAYDRLRQDFVFRPRGSFYLPRVGEARTFVLAGRL
ncbi:MAG TPA: cache domain-containing protein [Methylomirabilota bacterium]|nr:cache domain-containing protein [Methylomirabilota bacterium]